MQTLDQIHHTLLQAPELDTQNVHRPRVIILVQSLLRVVTTLDILRRQFLLESREVLANDLSDLLVGEVASGNEESLACRFGKLDAFDVGESEIAHVGPDVGPGFGDFRLIFAGYEVGGSLVGGVEAVEAVKVVDDWT